MGEDPLPSTGSPAVAISEYVELAEDHPVAVLDDLDDLVAAAEEDCSVRERLPPLLAILVVECPEAAARYPINVLAELCQDEEAVVRDAAVTVAVELLELPPIDRPADTERLVAVLADCVVEESVGMVQREAAVGYIIAVDHAARGHGDGALRLVRTHLSAANAAWVETEVEQRRPVVVDGTPQV